METPLHYACTNNTKNAIYCVDLLLSNGADPTARDCHNKTPLSIARLSSNKLVIRVLQIAYEVRLGRKCASCKRSFGMVSKMRTRMEPFQLKWPMYRPPKDITSVIELRKGAFCKILRCKECEQVLCPSCAISPYTLFSDGVPWKECPKVKRSKKHSERILSGTCPSCACNKFTDHSHKCLNLFL